MQLIINGAGETPSVPEKTKFSIFNPAITYEHREFYETIMGRLQGVFPICSQGEAAAVEISEDETEQQQVTDLMLQVEDFSHNLMEVTKNLFNQFYQEKEALYTGIISTIASNKINLIDRNLLERTCDIRWWAMETAFCDCIEFVSFIRSALQATVSPLQALLQSMKTGEMALTPIIREATQEMLTLLQSESQICFSQEAYQDFCFASSALRKALVPMEETSNFQEELLALDRGLKKLTTKISFACQRLEDINNSYTLYRDLVIVDPEGTIIANSNKATREKVLGLQINQEKWFIEALQSNSTNEYYAQDITYSKVEQQNSLVYATAIRSNSDESGEVIGAMGVFFDFQGEANLILDDYMPKDERQDISEGFYSLFTNEKGVIIASSDEIILEPGSFAHIPRGHRNLSKGEKHASYAVFEGTESAILTSKTEGYLDYEGLGWSSHIIIPKTAVFQNKMEALENFEVSSEILKHSFLIPKINRETYLTVQEDKESIQLISLNGIVFASKLGRRGAALDPLFRQITKTCSFATGKIEELLREMALGVLDLFSKALENLTKQAIDLIDRNLFERSADIRWWATDQYFWEALQSPSEKNFQAAAKRLRVINSSYSMYRNLVLVDSNGDFVACSRNELRNELKQRNYSGRTWFQEAMRLNSSGDYYVEDVSNSDLEGRKEMSLIYTGAVRKEGSRQGEVIGVLAILFDWDQEAKLILNSCLPQSRNEDSNEGIIAFYTNSQKVIIETNDEKSFPLGTKINLEEKFANLQAGESTSGFVTYKGTQYLLGSSKTKGYREYPGLSWCAHILRPVYS